MPDIAFDAINDALDRCSDLGFVQFPGFATHWPMGAETMIELGHPELVPDWLELYRTKHVHPDRPDSVGRIDGTDEASWRPALGRMDRTTDWQQFFDRELAEKPWREVLVEWWPRLIIGAGAALTHGLIRTTHIVRSFDRSSESPTQLQLGELAMGLGLWAGYHVQQPGTPLTLTGNRQLPALLASIPRVDLSTFTLDLRTAGAFAHVYDISGWVDAVGQLETPVDLQAAISDVTHAFARVNLAHYDQFAVPLIHTVTAPAALRLMLPHLPEKYHLPSFVAVWQAAAALLSTFAQPRPTELVAEKDSVPGDPPSEQELTERAIEHGDEHAMKYIEACMREYRIRPDALYLHAAEHMLGRLPNYYRKPKDA